MEQTFSKTSNLVDTIQKRFVKLMNNLVLSTKITLAHRRAVGDTCLNYRYFHVFCSNQLA